MTAMNAANTVWIALQRAENMAYFCADLCLYSPENYSLTEKRDICNEMMGTSKANPRRHARRLRAASARREKQATRYALPVGSGDT